MAEQDQRGHASRYVYAFAGFFQPRYHRAISTANLSPSDPLQAVVNEQVQSGGDGTSSEYVREMIRKEKDGQHLRCLLVEGVTSVPGPTADRAYFDGLRTSLPRAESLSLPIVQTALTG
jgi:antitoxin ParD1/3/4